MMEDRELFDIDLDLGSSVDVPAHSLPAKIPFMPLALVTLQTCWAKDTVLTGYALIGKGIYTPMTPAYIGTLQRSSRTSGFQPSQVRFADDPSKKFKLQDICKSSGKETVTHHVVNNTVMCFILLNLLLCTGYIVQTSIHQRKKEHVASIAYTITMFAIDVFVLEPVMSFVIALGRSLKKKRRNLSLECARKRSDEANMVLERRRQIQNINFIHRLSYYASWEYRGIGSNSFQHLVYELYQTKFRTFRRQTKEKGSPKLMLTIVCAIAIVNVHSNVNSSFLNGHNVAAWLDLHSQKEPPAFTVDEVWQYIETVYFRYYHSSESKESTALKLFGKIRQVRSIRTDCRKKIFPRLSIDKPWCHEPFSWQVEETRDFCSNWRKPLVKGQNKSCHFLFKYVHGNVDSVFEYLQAEYPLGGYQHIMNDFDEINREVLKDMKTMNWVDQRTEAILLESSAFDLDTGIAAAITVTFNFQPHGIRQSFKIHSFVFIFAGVSSWILLFALIAWSLLTLGEVSSQFSKIASQGYASFFKDADNILHSLHVMVHILLLAGFVYRAFLGKRKYDLFFETMYGTHGRKHITVRDVGFVVFTLNSFSGLLAFLALVLIFQSARKLKRLNIMLQLMRKSLFVSVGPAICILMIAALIYLVFHTKDYEASTFTNALSTLVEFMLDPRHGNKEFLNRFVAVALWFVFFIIITNGVLVAINDEYSVLVLDTKTKEERSKTVLKNIKEALIIFGFHIFEEDVQKVKEEDLEETSREQCKVEQRLLNNLSEGW